MSKKKKDRGRGKKGIPPSRRGLPKRPATPHAAIPQEGGTPVLIDASQVSISSRDMAPSAKADYTSFGEIGPAYQKVYDLTWQVAREGWNAAAAEFGVPSFSEAMGFALDKSGFLFERLMLLFAHYQVITNRDFVDLWEKFRVIFSPSLRNGAELTQRDVVTLRAMLLENIVKVRMTEPLRSMRYQIISGTCEGVFRDDELKYVKEHYPDVLDFACGSGYAIHQIGGNSVGIDDNSYFWTMPDAVPWTKELYEAGRLVIGGLDRLTEFAPTRALGLFYPEPGALYPAAALKSYTAAGGRTLLLKLGGFIGGGRSTADPRYVPPKNPGQNVLRFIQELLAGGWREVDHLDRPEWNAEAFDNNLLVFERGTRDGGSKATASVDTETITTVSAESSSAGSVPSPGPESPTTSFVHLHEMGLADQGRVHAFLSDAHGEAPVLVHPFNFGITEEERADTLAKAAAFARLGGGDPIPEGEIRVRQEQYLEGLSLFLNSSPAPVGFLFEAVDPGTLPDEELKSELLAGRLTNLTKFDRSGRIWVVIPTRWGRADPFFGSWDEATMAMRALGLGYAALGGCYLLRCNGQVVDLDAIPGVYACINDLGQRLLDAGIRAQVAANMTYIHDVTD